MFVFISRQNWATDGRDIFAQRHRLFCIAEILWGKLFVIFQNFLRGKSFHCHLSVYFVTTVSTILFRSNWYQFVHCLSTSSKLLNIVWTLIQILYIYIEIRKSQYTEFRVSQWSFVHCQSWTYHQSAEGHIWLITDTLYTCCLHLSIIFGWLVKIYFLENWK